MELFILLSGTSVSGAISVLSSPNASSILQSITVTCTIHPNSAADQCVGIAMADGRGNRTGNETKDLLVTVSYGQL